MKALKLISLDNLRLSIWKIEVYLFPFVVLALVAQAFDFLPLIFGHAVLGVIFAIFFMLWLLAVLMQIILLLTSSADREFFVQRLCGITERDEREELIVAKASRASFIITTALLVVLLVLSTFQYTRPLVDTAPKGFYSFTVGNISVFESKGTSHEIEREGQKQQVLTYDLPISKFGIILILLVSQIGTLVLRGRHRGQMG